LHKKDVSPPRTAESLPPTPLSDLISNFYRVSLFFSPPPNPPCGSLPPLFRPHFKGVFVSIRFFPTLVSRIPFPVFRRCPTFFCAGSSALFFFFIRRTLAESVAATSPEVRFFPVPAISDHSPVFSWLFLCQDFFPFSPLGQAGFDPPLSLGRTAPTSQQNLAVFLYHLLFVN